MLDGFQMKDSREMLNIWDLKYNKHNKLLQEQRQPALSLTSLSSPTFSPIVVMFLYCFILNTFATNTSATNTLADNNNNHNNKLDSKRIGTVLENRINSVNMSILIGDMREKQKREAANNVPESPDYNYDDEDDEYQILKNKSGEFHKLTGHSY